jgi:hypothetical protein
MNNEQQELLDEAYIKYQNQTMFHTDDLVPLKELDGMYMSTGEKTKVYRQFAPKEFINKCKTDKDFSEKWGLKIEERELIRDERYNLMSTITRHSKESIESRKKINNFEGNTPGVSYHEEWLDSFNIPTKIINISYNNKKIESYEY